jgi:hypothetical protein
MTPFVGARLLTSLRGCGFTGRCAPPNVDGLLRGCSSSELVDPDYFWNEMKEEILQ